MELYVSNVARTNNNKGNAGRQRYARRGGGDFAALLAGAVRASAGAGPREDGFSRSSGPPMEAAAPPPDAAATLGMQVRRANAAITCWLVRQNTAE